MTAKRLLLLTLALLALSRSLPGQDPARPRRGGYKLVDLTVPANVEVVSDIVYAEYGDRQLKLDLCLPKPRPAEPVPGVIAIRGGGWQRGDKEGFAPIAANLAARGFAVASIEYRTVKETAFPACVNDCKAAVRWMRAEGTRYGIRTNTIGAIGGSAGGHLAALLGTSYKAANLEGEGGHPGISSRVQAVVAMAPVFDFRTLAGVKEKGGEVPRVLFANDQKQIKRFSPATYLDADSAPVLLMQSKIDNTVPFQQSLDMLASAKKANVRAELWALTDSPHFFWNIEKWFPETIDRAANFFNSVFDQGK